MRDRRHPQTVVRAWSGSLCKAIHVAEFSVGDSYHVVGSERDISTAWRHLAGSGMFPLPTIAAGPRRGPGPIRAPDSGDDTSLRGGPPPRTMGYIQGRWRSHWLSLFFCSRMRWIWSSPSTLPSCRHRPDSASTSLPFSAHMSLTPPTHLVPPTTPSTRSRLWLLHPSPFLHARRSRRILWTTPAARIATKQEMVRQLWGRYRPVEHPPKTYWWHDQAIV